MALKMIQVGCGGFGGMWCSRFLPPNVKDGLVEVVAAVDTNPEALKNAQEHLSLKASQCYTDIRKAFDKNKADFCTVVVPPPLHEGVVDAALAHDMHILSEKPIADTLEASCRIAAKVKAAGKKMGVTMSHRFRQDITTLRTLAQSGKYGPLDYAVCRFTWDARNTDGTFRYTMDHPMLIDAAVHHLDLLVDITGAKCDTIYAQTWRPGWTEHQGDCQGMVVMNSENGVHSLYEGADANAVGLNNWLNEYIRAECKDATLVLSHQKIERFDHGVSPQGPEGTGQPMDLIDQPKWANAWLIEKFAKWLDGGEPMETNVEDNLQSVALVFAAIESSRTGQPIKVQEFLSKTRKQVESQM